MAEVKIEYSKNQVDKAGKVLKDDSSSAMEKNKAMDVLSNWRAVHFYPINTFQATLRLKLNFTGNKNALVAQRLKRTPSIIGKLKRIDGMKLSRMQDIGGLRAVVSSLPKVRELEKNYAESKFKHELVRKDDYITTPKSSGYRGIHLVYRYQNDRNKEYDGLQIELQLRTKLQHAWATAVETMGTFIQHALKSSEGPEEWLEFFALVGSAFANEEGTEKLEIHSDLTPKQISKQIKISEEKLDVIKRLNAFSVVTETLKPNKKEGRGRKGHFHIITLSPKEGKVSISSYGKIDLAKATEDYTRIEKELSQKSDGSQVVLVQNVSISNLRIAYPNYFLDTQEFIKIISRITAS